MSAHLDYIRYIKSKTVVVVNANDPTDITKVRNNNESEFKNLVTAASSDDQDKGMLSFVYILINCVLKEMCNTVAYLFCLKPHESHGSCHSSTCMHCTANTCS